MRNKVLDAFHNQLIQSRKRGIAFKFTYVQWVTWWLVKLGPDWFTLRGRGRDKFCMARKGDKGAYEANNVKCITGAQNRLEMKMVGPGRGVPKLRLRFKDRRSKLSKKSIEAIKTSQLSAAQLAPLYGVSEGTIRRRRRN